MQLLLVAFFGAQLANDLGAAIVGRVVGVINIFFFPLIDTTDIANDVAGRLLHRIGSEQTRLDIHARKAIALRRKLGDFLIRQTRTNGDGLKAFGVIHQPLELAPVTRSDLHDFGQTINRLVQILNLGARNLERVSGVITRKHNAITVQNLPPVRHNRHHGRAIALGPLGQLLMPFHLQHQQARHQHAKRQQHHPAHDNSAQPKALQLSLGIANLHHRRDPKHRRSTESDV